MRTGLVELHLHLDGSLNNKWAYETSKKRGSIDKDLSFDDFLKLLTNMNFKSREESFVRFEITCNALQTKEDLHDGMYYLIKDLANEGIIYAEIRFAPQQHCLKGLSQKEAVEAVLSGLEDASKDYPDILCKVINCLMHKGNSALFNDKENRETIEVTKEYLGKGVVGLDLAGFENNCDFNEYAYLFEIAREYGIPYTIHAAEMGEGKHIVDALKMKPNRIGHGINCIQNPEWLKMVVDSKIPLEVCVTSNTRGRLPSYVDHPVRKLLEAGAYVTLNSDNMSLAETDIESDHRRLKRMGVSEETLIDCEYKAIEAAFCSKEEKELLIKKLNSIFNRKY